MALKTEEGEGVLTASTVRCLAYIEPYRCWLKRRLVFTRAQRWRGVEESCSGELSAAPIPRAVKVGRRRPPGGMVISATRRHAAVPAFSPLTRVKGKC